MSVDTKRPPRRYPACLPPGEFDALYLSIIRSELRLGRPLPDAARLIELGYPGLPAEIRGHGGRQNVLKRFGYWDNPDRAYEIIRHLCTHGYLPTPTALRRAGFNNIVCVIHGQFGVEAFAHQYGLRCWKTDELRRRNLHRQRAVGKTIAALARKKGCLPRHDELGAKAETIVNHNGGVTALLRKYLEGAKNVHDGVWLATLHGPRPRSSYKAWTERKLARALWPYVVRWIRSGGQIAITTMIHEDQRWDLRHLVSRYGGIQRLLEEPCFPQRAMKLLWLSYVEGELLRLAPDEFRRRILPPRTFFLCNAPTLEHIIHKRCGGYRTVATALDMHTRRDALQIASRRDTLNAVLNQACKRGTFPTVTELRWRDRRMVHNAHGLPLFLRQCSGIRELRLIMSQTALRWRRECRRNGHDKRRHTLLLDSAALLLTIVQDAQRYRRSFRFR